MSSTFTIIFGIIAILLPLVLGAFSGNDSTITLEEATQSIWIAWNTFSKKLDLPYSSPSSFFGLV
jgi:hypothetical protein